MTTAPDTGRGSYSWLSNSPLMSLRLTSFAATPKPFEKNEGIRLSAAQDRVAREHGFPRWADLVAGRITVLKEDGYLYLTRMIGEDEIVISLDQLLEDHDATGACGRLPKAP